MTASRVRAHLGALAFMVGGCALIFSMLILMNAQNQPPPKEEKKASGVMTIEKEKKKKKKKKLVRKVKRKRKSRAQPRAPMPNLAASLSGVSFGLPQFDGATLEAASGSVLGEESSVAGMVMTEDTVDVTPRALARNAPTYPPRARAKGVTGQVTLSLLIGSDGKVQRVKVLSAEPSGVFEDSAVEAVERWQFEPALYKGEKVKVWARQVLTFSLS